MTEVQRFVARAVVVVIASAGLTITAAVGGFERAVIIGLALLLAHAITADLE